MKREHLLADFGPPDRSQELQAGDYLFRRDDDAHGAFVLESGHVQLIRALESGNELTLHRVYPGSSFAEAALFNSTYHCDCRAPVVSRVAVYSISRLTASFAHDPRLALTWAHRLADQVRHQRTLLEVRAIASAEERIVAYLRMPAHEGSAVELPSLRALAAELGLAEETVYRAVSRLVSAGRVERMGATLWLGRPKSLAQT